jgi:hypothetical protein
MTYPARVGHAAGEDKGEFDEDGKSNDDPARREQQLSLSGCLESRVFGLAGPNHDGALEALGVDIDCPDNGAYVVLNHKSAIPDSRKTTVRGRRDIRLGFGTVLGY